MTQRQEHFEVGTRPKLVVRNAYKEIEIVSGDDHRIDVTIDKRGYAYDVEQLDADSVAIRPCRGRLRGGNIRVRVPDGTRIVATNASGDIVVEATVATLEATVASGRLRAADVAGSVQITTGSGDVGIAHVGGVLSVVSASGDVHIEHAAGDVRVKTASGDVSIERADADASLRSSSGDLSVGQAEGGDVEMTTTSGDIAVGVPPRRRVELDMHSRSGRLRNDLAAGDGSPPEATIHLSASSQSGDITVHGT